VIDVYFTHIPNSGEATFRNHLARACLERWRLDDRAHVVLLQPRATKPLVEGIPFIEAHGRDRFHVDRYRLAQKGAKGSWFVVADDDCLPLGRNFVTRALNVAGAQTRYGVLAASDVVTGSPSSPDCVDVAESFAVGGICLISPSAPHFGFEVDLPTEADGARYREVKAAGLLEGRMAGVCMNHLGYGFSTACPGHWASH